MARGAVYFHPQFKFHDNEIGEKRFVALHDPLAERLSRLSGFPACGRQALMSGIRRAELRQKMARKDGITASLRDASSSDEAISFSLHPAV